MADLPARRGFLGGLAALPLIGGVTLVGNPTGAAEPVTGAMLDQYETWLMCEASRLAREVHPWSDGRVVTSLFGPAYEWHQADVGSPCQRAAVVLSAVGCDWRTAR
jgi:hypothetical protein